MQENGKKNIKPKGVYRVAALIILSDVIILWNEAQSLFNGGHVLATAHWHSRLIYSFGAVPVALRGQFFSQRPGFFYDILLIGISFGCALGLIRFKNLARIILIVFCWINIVYVISIFFPSFLGLLEKEALSFEFFRLSMRDYFPFLLPASIYSIYLTYPKVRWRFR